MAPQWKQKQSTQDRENKETRTLPILPSFEKHLSEIASWIPISSSFRGGEPSARNTLAFLLSPGFTKTKPQLRGEESQNCKEENERTTKPLTIRMPPLLLRTNAEVASRSPTPCPHSPHKRFLLHVRRAEVDFLYGATSRAAFCSSIGLVPDRCSELQVMPPPNPPAHLHHKDPVRGEHTHK